MIGIKETLPGGNISQARPHSGEKDSPRLAGVQEPDNSLRSNRL